MHTTIQIKNVTLEKLKRLKKEKKASSYDQIIDILITHEQNLPDSLLGFMKNKTESFIRDVDDHDHEL